MRFAFIHDQSGTYEVGLLCRVLEVPRSSYYAWRSRTASDREQEDRRLSELINEIFNEYRQVYGAPRIHRELVARGEKVSRKRVARLMRENGLKACQTLSRRPRTTDSKHGHPIADNVLNRDFDVTEPNRVWASDITYVNTTRGWLYLAVVIDLYSRAVVGWATSSSLATDVVLRALDDALGRRTPAQGLLHHSDRGCQYASDAFQLALKKAGISCSMSRKGNCWDNAVVESFFHSLKTEHTHRVEYKTRDEARSSLFEYIEVFYNQKRRHSTLGYLAPLEYERIMAA